MIARGNVPYGTSRPYNNLLRLLSAGDFALIESHLAREEAEASNLLYNPGDNVDTVHFPCGPSLASFMVPNEDGRDVETILVGREGAVGGIVSQGYLPAYTRITVKFGGPFMRLMTGDGNRFPRIGREDRYHDVRWPRDVSPDRASCRI